MFSESRFSLETCNDSILLLFMRMYDDLQDGITQRDAEHNIDCRRPTLDGLSIF